MHKPFIIKTWGQLILTIWCFLVVPAIFIDWAYAESKKPLCERSWNHSEVRCVRYWMDKPIPQ